MEKNYYKILEVPEDATQEVIKKSFRKLAKKYHPDTNSGNQEAAQKFQEINEAYSILGDEEKKKSYDEQRKYGSQSQAKQGSNSKAGRAGKTANPFQGFSQSNFKMDFGDMMFEELNGKNKQSSKQGQDINFADVSSQFASFFGFKPK